jgi:hypothetical protein
MSKLNGQLIFFCFDEDAKARPKRTRSGFHTARITGHAIAKRATAGFKVGDIRSISVALINVETGKFTGQKVKLRPCEWQNKRSGVYVTRTKQGVKFNEFVRPEEYVV